MQPFIFRPLTRHDVGELVAFHERCSERTHYLRFFAAKPHLRLDEAEYLCAVDQQARGALAVVDAYDSRTIHGVGRSEPVSEDAAEVAFVIEDSHQRRGIGRALMSAILARTKHAGYHEATADALAANRPMRSLLRCAGYVYSERPQAYGEVQFVLDLNSQQANSAKAVIRGGGSHEDPDQAGGGHQGHAHSP